LGSLALIHYSSFTWAMATEEPAVHLSTSIRPPPHSVLLVVNPFDPLNFAVYHSPQEFLKHTDPHCTEKKLPSNIKASVVHPLLFLLPCQSL